MGSPAVVKVAMFGITEHSAHKRHRNTLVLVCLVAFLLLCLTWVHALSLSSQTRERELANAERDLANITRLSQEHTNRTLRSADQVIRFIRSRYQEVGERLDLAQLANQGVIDTEIFNQVGVINADGIYILSNRPIKERLDLSDRTHFKVHVNSDDEGLFVSQPVLGRASGLWSIQLTRRINKPNGDFGGVVVVSIDPGYFTRFYSELNLGPGGLTALYGLDGIARARKVGSQEEFGTNAAGSQTFVRLAKNELQGSYSAVSVVDGTERLFYFRKVPQYQLVMVAGFETRFLLANYEKAHDALVLQAALVTLLVFILAGGIARHLWLLRSEATTRRNAQVQILDRQEQLNAVLELSPGGFVSFDKNHCVKYVNPAFHQMMGQPGLTLEGLEEHDFSAWLSSLCDPATRFTGVETLRVAAASNAASGSQTIELRDPIKRVLQVQIRLSSVGSVSQILYFRDITHETEVESLKSEFLATAAHELRTPMASIYGFTEVLMSDSKDPELRQEFLGIIHRQSKLMVQILNELLDLARIEARRGKDFQFRRLDLRDLLADLIRAFQCPAGRTSPELDAPQSPVLVMADSGKLRQALLNVISNAYKYSPAGGPVLVRVDLPAEGRVCIHVSDHGIGMTASQVAKVFTRFYRADTSGKVPGTGLGMSITEEIITYHQGTISIVSSPGNGSKVTITMPMDTSVAAQITIS
jgi:signal transduction histidine kinase